MQKYLKTVWTEIGKNSIGIIPYSSLLLSHLGWEWIINISANGKYLKWDYDFAWEQIKSKVY